jgi:hypothetical protein
MHFRLAAHKIVLIFMELQIKLVHLHCDMYLSYDIMCWYCGIMAQRSVEYSGPDCGNVTSINLSSWKGIECYVI